MQDTKLDRIVGILRKERKQGDAFVPEKDPFRVLIATILSQRTRDENTDRACKNLFSKYRTPEQISSAPRRHLEHLIRPSGFYRVKAKRIQEVSRILLERFRGKTPDRFSDLISLPGVGRKTANCVLVFGFRKPAIPVDTHVHRISNRLGLVRTRRPEETEEELKKVLPRRFWLGINGLLVRFGREICLPRYPKCDLCKISRFCRR